ncbi:hypothetical protein [Methylomagnum sp.]
MAKSDFIPIADNDFLAWLDNFAAQGEAHQADLGLTEAQTEQIKATAASARAKFAAQVQAQAAARHATEEKESRPPRRRSPVPRPGPANQGGRRLHRGVRCPAGHCRAGQRRGPRQPQADAERRGSNRRHRGAELPQAADGA